MQIFLSCSEAETTASVVGQPYQTDGSLLCSVIEKSVEDKRRNGNFPSMGVIAYATEVPD
jgi:hypothetical protein